MKQKECTKCHQKCLRTKEYFPPNKKAKDGLGSWCRKCSLAASADWRNRNKEYYKEYCEQNKERLYEYAKKYHKTLRGYISQRKGKIEQRCTDKKDPKYKYYGGRGIQCLFTTDELFEWLVATNTDPRGLEIHRIDNDGNYTLDNIVFVTDEEHKQLHKNIKNELRLKGKI